MSPFHPAIVAYFIISFDLYFFYKTILTAVHAVISYRAIQQVKNISFSSFLRKKRNNIHHVIIIPNYKEPLSKLIETITAISKQDYPFKEKVSVVLAFESRETDAKKKGDAIKQLFSHSLGSIQYSFHTLVTGEVAGKASNQSWATRSVALWAEKHNIPFENILITICDADSILPSNYLSYLTCEALKDEDRKFHFYWAPVLLYNNFWKLPFFVRMQATLSSILRLAFLSQGDSLIQISTYSTTLWLLRSVGYWDVDIIPEDWHIYFQAFFTHGKRVKTIPLFTLVNGDAVYSGSIFKTLVNRYEQEKRWAWGVSDIGYTVRKFASTPHISIRDKAKRLQCLVETHLLWPISFFILTISASIPPLINPNFKRTVLGFILPQLSGFILTLTSLFLILYVFLDIKLRNHLSIPTKMRFLPLLLIQWYLLPIISFFLSALPSLESHTRLLLGKKLEYKVTEKA